jgi:hypothetical protein
LKSGNTGKQHINNIENAGQAGYLSARTYLAVKIQHNLQYPDEATTPVQVVAIQQQTIPPRSPKSDS